MKLGSLLRQRLAAIPLGMSLVALLIVGGHIAVVGSARRVDEGADAHMFRLIIAAQIPLITCFAFRWLRRAPGPAISVIALQAAAICAALAPVACFSL